MKEKRKKGFKILFQKQNQMIKIASAFKIAKAKTLILRMKKMMI